MNKQIKVIVLYRVIQEWRRPVFASLSDMDSIDLEVWHGCDFRGTKVVSTKKVLNFKSRKLFSIPINLGKLKQGLYLPFSPLLLINLIRSKPDVIICEGASNFINNASAYIYCKLFNKKIIQWGLGEIRGQNRSFLRRLLDVMIVPIEKGSDACIAYSSIGKNYYQRLGHSQEDVFVAVNVVDTDSRKAALEKYKMSSEYLSLESQRNNFNVIFVGALESNKSIEVLIEAFSKFAQNKKDATLTIVGDGSYRSELELLVQRLDICCKVEFKGKVVEDIERIFAHSDVFVMPGLGGLAVSDALCHGVPVVCGIGDGCEFDLINHDNGILDDKLDFHGIINHLELLYLDPARVDAMKLAAARTIEKYNIKGYRQQIYRCIHHVYDKH